MPNRAIPQAVTVALDAFQIATRDAAIAVERVGSAVNSRDYGHYAEAADLACLHRNAARDAVEQAIADALHDVANAIARAAREVDDIPSGGAS